jgi:hypothetical protein
LKVVFIIAIFFIAGTSCGQKPPATNWITVQTPVSLGKDWQWQNDVSYRTIGFSIATYQYLFRTGIAKQINNHWNTAAGVAFFNTRTSYEKINHQFRQEFRLWQEAAHQKDITGSWQLQQRLRIEERFFKASGTSIASQAIRYRYRAAIIKRLTEKWSVRLADEYMLQTANGKTGFNQNRVLLTGSMQLGKTVQLIAGCMWVKRPSFSQNVFLYTFQKNFTTDGRKRNGK